MYSGSKMRSLVELGLIRAEAFWAGFIRDLDHCKWSSRLMKTISEGSYGAAKWLPFINCTDIPAVPAWATPAPSPAPAPA